MKRLVLLACCIINTADLSASSALNRSWQSDITHKHPSVASVLEEFIDSKFVEIDNEPVSVAFLRFKSEMTEKEKVTQEVFDQGFWEYVETPSPEEIDIAKELVVEAYSLASVLSYAQQHAPLISESLINKCRNEIGIALQPFFYSDYNLFEALELSCIPSEFVVSLYAIVVPPEEGLRGLLRCSDESASDFAHFKRKDWDLQSRLDALRLTDASSWFLFVEYQEKIAKSVDKLRSTLEMIKIPAELDEKIDLSISKIESELQELKICFQREYSADMQNRNWPLEMQLDTLTKRNNHLGFLLGKCRKIIAQTRGILEFLDLQLKTLLVI